VRDKKRRLRDFRRPPPFFLRPRNQSGMAAKLASAVNQNPKVPLFRSRERMRLFLRGSCRRIEIRGG